MCVSIEGYMLLFNVLNAHDSLFNVLCTIKNLFLIHCLYFLKIFYVKALMKGSYRKKIFQF